MKKKAKPKLTRTDKRFLVYAEKLRVLRQYVSGFDSPSWEQAYFDPVTDAARSHRRRSIIAQVSNKYNVLKPYLIANKKRVVPKTAANVQALRQYAQLPNIRGLRAVPIEAVDPTKLRVRFSQVKVKRPPARGHKKPRIVNVIKVSVREGKFRQEFYPFPRTVKSIIKSEGYENLADEITDMLNDMMPELPEGIYIFRHKHFMMLEPKSFRDTFAKRATIFFTTDSGEKHFVVSNLVGVIRLADQDPIYLGMIAQMREGRTRAQQQRARDKLRAREKNIRKFIKRSKRK